MKNINTCSALALSGLALATLGFIVRSNTCMPSKRNVESEPEPKPKPEPEPKPERKQKPQKQQKPRHLPKLNLNQKRERELYAYVAKIANDGNASARYFCHQICANFRLGYGDRRVLAMLENTCHMLKCLEVEHERFQKLIEDIREDRVAQMNDIFDDAVDAMRPRSG